MRRWNPAICPSGSCLIEHNILPDNSTDWEGAPKAIWFLCPHHEKIKTDNGLDDTGIYKAILQTNRVLETARAAVKSGLGLDKEHPGVDYRVEIDGSITILTDTTSLAWRLPDRSAGPVPVKTRPEREAAKLVAETEMAKVDQPLGVAVVRVEV